MLSIILLCVTASFADNPIVQTLFTADPAPMVYKDTVYLYTGHDADVLVGGFYTMDDWRYFSSTDMVNWTHHGSPLSPKAFSWTQDGNAWAGQCIYRNGKFYYYVPMKEKNGGFVVGVAVSTSPTGPFTDPLGHKLVAFGNGWDIDPTVFIDDDGQAYLYWGGGGTTWYVKLNEDMISYSGNIVQINPKLQIYTEGPWFYKRNALYYMVYAATPPNSAENISYATSNSPTGPWTFKGTIMPTQGGSFTNHPGVIDFKGNSYLFYHNGDLPGGGGFNRSVCVEQFAYNADGTFPSIKMTKDGPPQIGSLNPFDTVQAETICWESGIKTESCSEGGINVNSIHNGDYIKIKGVDFGSGAKSFDARVASATSGGNIELRLGSQTGTLVGTCSVQGTGGKQTWATKSCAVSGVTGKHDLYLKFTGGSGDLFNFNWWKFNASTRIGVEKGEIAKHGNIIKIKAYSGKTPSLQLDFSSSDIKKNLRIRLFDLKGHLVSTLSKERSDAQQLIFPLNHEAMCQGTYLVRVSSNNKILIEKCLIFHN